MREEKATRSGTHFSGNSVSPGDPVEKRMRPSVRRTKTGCVFAATGTAAAIVTCLSVPDVPGKIWVLAIVALLAMLAMAGICAFQGWVWNTALSGWRRHRSTGLMAFMTPSWMSHLVSYPIALLGVVSNGWLFVSLAHGSLAWWSSLACGVCLVAAQASGAVEFLRLSGPRGGVRMHLQRLTHRGANR